MTRPQTQLEGEFFMPQKRPNFGESGNRLKFRFRVEFLIANISVEAKLDHENRSMYDKRIQMILKSYKYKRER